MSIKQLAVRLVSDEGGQDLIEYGLLAALISIVAVIAITSVGTRLTVTYQNISASLP